MTEKNNKNSKLKIIILIAAILAITAVCISYAVYNHKVLYHFETVDPGKVYRSGTLSQTGLKKVNAMTGLKTIINLRADYESEGKDWYVSQKAFADKNGIKMIDIFMDSGCPPGPEDVDRFLEIVKDSSNHPLLLHCEQGVIRTGMMVAVYEVLIKKRDSAEVLKNMPTFGHKLEPRISEFILSLKVPSAEPKKTDVNVKER